LIFAIFGYMGKVVRRWAPLPDRGASVVIVWLFVFVLCGCAELPPAPTRPMTSGRPLSSLRDATPEIGVLIAGWHTGIVLPAEDLGPLAPLFQIDSHAKYVSVGWGDRRFYMAAHPGSGDAVAALFPSRSVLFVQRVSTPTELSEPDTTIHWLCADRQAISRLDIYIEESLARDAGMPVDLGGGPLPDSRFYASIGHYSAVHTCNTWVVAALQYAGLPVSAAGVVLASQVKRRVSGLRACQAPRD
jgi:uncharacterized protein (TIGR02117 family)